jgi:D-aspartate ligase
MDKLKAQKDPTRGGAGRNKALVLGSGITLLGVIRALSEAGVDVFALPEADMPARRSRWYRAGPRVLSGVRPETLAQVLIGIPRRTVLFPCSDQWALAIAALPAELRNAYPASVAPLDALELLIDKTRFRAALEELGLPHPATRTLASVADLDALPDSRVRGSFLKPAHSQEFFGRFGVKAFPIAEREAARRRLATAIEGGFEMMLQEYIPGPPANHYYVEGFVDRAGIMRALFARRRLRMSPPDFGNSTLMISVPLAEVGDAPATLKSLFTHIGYRGIFSAEFKRDERNGVFNLIEVNARAWWYVEFASRCGVNVCELALRDALGESVDTISSYDVGRRCVFPYHDLDAVRADLSAGRVGVVGWARSWIGPFQPVFRWSDPAPALGEIASLIGERIRRRRSR